MGTRTATFITVSVLDLSQVLARSLEQVRESRPEVVAVAAEGGQWGVIDTPLGLYVLNHHGIGPDVPVTTEDPMVIGIFAAVPDGAGVRREAMPSMLLAFDPESVPRLPLLDQRNLSAFIRGGDPELERRYEIWRRALERATA